MSSDCSLEGFPGHRLRTATGGGVRLLGKVKGCLSLEMTSSSECSSDRNSRVSLRHGRDLMRHCSSALITRWWGLERLFLFVWLFSLELQMVGVKFQYLCAGREKWFAGWLDGLALDSPGGSLSERPAGKFPLSTYLEIFSCRFPMPRYCCN